MRHCLCNATHIIYYKNIMIKFLKSSNKSIGADSLTLLKQSPLI